MIDRLNELKILVYQTCSDIYQKSHDNKLSEDEYAFFISSIAYELISGIYQYNKKKLEGPVVPTLVEDKTYKALEEQQKDGDKNDS